MKISVRAGGALLALALLVTVPPSRAAGQETTTAGLEVDSDVVGRCRKNVSKLQRQYLKKYQREWGRCYAATASGTQCEAITRDVRIVAMELKLRERIGGVKDKRCLGAGLTPLSLGHGAACPPPCAEHGLADMTDLASCAVCLAQALGAAALDAGYGNTPPSMPPLTPAGDPAKCQQAVAKAAKKLAEDWTRVLAGCEDANARGKNDPPLDCAADPVGEILTAVARADGFVARCIDFSDLTGCASAGDIAGTQACVEAAIADPAQTYTSVAYP